MKTANLGGGGCAMGLEPHSKPGPSTSAYFSSLWTSRLRVAASLSNSESIRSTVLVDCCVSSHAACMSSTLLRSSSEYGTAHTNLPVKGWEGEGGFLQHHSFPRRVFTNVGIEVPTRLLQGQSHCQDCIAGCCAGLDPDDGGYAHSA